MGRFNQLIAALLMLVLAAFSHAGVTAAAEERAGLTVPKGLVVEARHVKLTRAMTMMRAGKPIETDEIVEFEVTAKEPIPARALDPVLVVGERLVSEYRYTAPNVLVFTEPRPRMLKDDSAVVFQWGRQPVNLNRLKLRFVYRLDALAQETR